MDFKELEKSGRIILSCISGSHAYGTNRPDSDIDIKGIFIHPDKAYLHALNTPEPQIGDDRHDITYYSLQRIFELLQKANPNIIELLWTPEDCIKVRHVISDKLIANRDLFISKECFETHSGYAFAQIKKAKGQNKKVHKAGFFEKGLNKLSVLLNKKKITDEWLESRFGETIQKEVRKRADKMS